jgi:hypothetical protein
MNRHQLQDVHISRTDPELEVHSVVDEKMSPLTKCSEDIISGQETEPSDRYQERREVGNNSAASVQISCETQKRFNEYGYDDTVPVDCEDHNKLHKLDLGCQYTWSDDEELPVFESERFGSSIHDSIRAIRKEASKIDAVLAVDQVDRLQEEMKNLHSELKRRDAETVALSALVQKKDDHIGTLELERDLYKADTTKLANDLECCLSKLRRVGGTSSPISVGYGSSASMRKLNDTDISSISKESVNPSLLPNTLNQIDIHDPIIPLETSTSGQDSRSWGNSPAGTSATTATTGTISSPGMKSLNSAPAVEAPATPSILPVTEKPRTGPFLRRGTPSHAVSVNITNSQQRRTNVLSFAFCRSNTNQKSQKSSAIKPSQKKCSIVAIDHQIQNHSDELEVESILEKSQSDQVQMPRGLLQEQVQEMSQRLQSSIKTSEDLRRRLATVQFYYDQHVNQLDRRVMEACVEQTKLKFDYSCQQSRLDRQHKAALAELGYKNRSQDADGIKNIRKSRVVTFDV